MRTIKAVLFEPVGCLAEFPAEPFNDIAVLFDEHNEPTASGSDAFWRAIDLIQASGSEFGGPRREAVERLEMEAVSSVELYDDVRPALQQLKDMRIALLLASSLSTVAVDLFVRTFALDAFFPSIWTRDTAGGVQATPLVKAIESASIGPEHVMCLVDTVDSLEMAKQVGANSILMINDYDEGRRLAMRAPAGGIVSLHELPDAIRFIAERAQPRRP